ncbi:unnamed protein product [Mucor hiemalis]
MSRESSFLKVFQDADNQIYDDSEEDPFPAYIDGIDTTLAPFCPTSATRVIKALSMAKVDSNDVVVDWDLGMDVLLRQPYPNLMPLEQLVLNQMQHLSKNREY